MPRGSLSHWLQTSPAWGAADAAGGDQNTATSDDAHVKHADVLIIGAGITGCSLAYHLRNLDPTLKVVVVEARGISEGATGRNGGIMWPSLCAPWPATVAQYGVQGAKQLMQFELHCFQDVQDFITEHALEEEVQFSLFPDGGLTLCESKEEMDAELSDLALQRQVGLEPLAVPLTPEQLTARLGKHHFVGGLCQEKVARVTAVRLAHALLKRAAAVQPGSSLTVLQHTRVVALQRLPTGAGARYRAVCRPEDSGTVTSRQGGTAGARDVVVHAAKVVHCTNGYNELLPQLTRMGWLVPVRNQVTVTCPVPLDHPLPQAAYYSRNGYVYWSRRHDGHVVIGGFRDVTPHMEWGTSDDSSEGLDSYVSAQLQAYLPSALPDLFAPPATKPHNAGARGHAPHAGRPLAPQQNVLMVSHTSAPSTDRTPNPHDTSHAAEKWTSRSSSSPPSVPSTAQGKAPMPVSYELEWSGILGFTKDHWPLWGALPPELASNAPTGPGGGPTYEYVCMGFSGYGMVRAYNCTRNLALLLTGKPLEAGFPAKVLAPTRCLAAPASKM